MDKIKQLLQSRKFWAALIPFAVTIVTYFFDMIDPAVLAALLTAISGVYILATAHEDSQVVAKKLDWNYNHTINQQQQYLKAQEELLKKYAAKDSSVTNSADKVRDPKTGAITNSKIKDG